MAKLDLLLEAKGIVKAFLGDWERGDLPVPLVPLVESIRVLIAAKGGQGWVKRRPRLKQDTPQPLHLAASDPEDQRKHREVLVVEYEGETLYVRPEDAHILLK